MAKRPASSPSVKSRSGLPAKVTLTSAIPADIRELLGPPPLTDIEDAQAYEATLARVAQAVGPTDFIEWIWVKDVVDLSWEAARARAAKAARLSLGRRTAIEKVFKSQHYPKNSHNREEHADKAHRAMTGAEDACDDLERALALTGLTEADLNAVAYTAALDDLERLDRLISNANARRDTILREIVRRRDGVARRLREAASTAGPILDAHFEDAPA